MILQKNMRPDVNFSVNTQLFFLAGEGLTGVRIKMFAPNTEERSRLPKNGTIGVMEYNTIGKFLPLSYHDSRLDMKHPVK